LKHSMIAQRNDSSKQSKTGSPVTYRGKKRKNRYGLEN
jgi:hypothetical protein